MAKVAACDQVIQCSLFAVYLQGVLNLLVQDTENREYNRVVWSLYVRWIANRYPLVCMRTWMCVSVFRWGVRQWWSSSITVWCQTTSGSSSKVSISSRCWWKPSSLRDATSTGTPSSAGVCHSDASYENWLLRDWLCVTVIDMEGNGVQHLY